MLDPVLVLLRVTNHTTKKKNVRSQEGSRVHEDTGHDVENGKHAKRDVHEHRSDGEHRHILQRVHGLIRRTGTSCFKAGIGFGFRTTTSPQHDHRVTAKPKHKYQGKHDSQALVPGLNRPDIEEATCAAYYVLFSKSTSIAVTDYDNNKGPLTM